MIVRCRFYLLPSIRRGAGRRLLSQLVLGLGVMTPLGEAELKTVTGGIQLGYCTAESFIWGGCLRNRFEPSGAEAAAATADEEVQMSDNQVKNIKLQRMFPWLRIFTQVIYIFISKIDTNNVTVVETALVPVETGSSSTSS